MSEFIDELKTLCRQGGIEAGQDVLERMEEYYECMKETNRLYNLTAITEPKEAALKHFLTALSQRGDPGEKPRGGCWERRGLSGCAAENPARGYQRVCGGILKEEVRFYRTGSAGCGIDITVMNVPRRGACHGQTAESLRCLQSRASQAQLRVLMELCAPLLKDGGRFLAYKGDTKKELNEAAGAMKALNLKLDKVIDMPGGDLCPPYFGVS